MADLTAKSVFETRIERDPPFERLLEECEAMVRFGSRRGDELPLGALATVRAARAESAAADPEVLTALVATHRRLSATVTPASPGMIIVLEREGDSRLRYLGPTAYIRALMILALLSLVGMAVCQGLAALDTETWAQFAGLVLAAATGAFFFVLTALYRGLASGQFESGDEGKYSLTIVLGVLAGTALALSVDVGGPTDTSGMVLTGQLVALLGGFSAEAVHRILERLVSTLEALVSGPQDEGISSQERDLVRSQAAADVSRAQTDVARRLAAVSARIGQETTTGSVRSEIDDLVDGLLRDPTAVIPMPAPDPREDAEGG